MSPTVKRNGKLLFVPQKLFSLLLAGILCSTTSGCVPPAKPGASSNGTAQTPRVADGGHPVIKINPVSPGSYQTVLKNGIEYRQARGPVGQFGGILYTSELGDGPKTFNPWASYDANSSSMGEMLLSGLVDTDAYTGKVVPNLAKTVEIAPDHLTYTVTLRKGLTWSDGKPITSKDVVFTWNTILKQGLGNPSTRDTLLIKGEFPAVKALDTWTIQFKTPEPFAPFERQLSTSIAPAHIFEPIIQKGGDQAFSAAWGVSDAATHPEKFVSSGMWLLDKYVSGEQVSFKKNPHFHMVDAKSQQLPYLDKVITRYVKDLNNRQLLFEQGKLDTYDVQGNFVAHTRELKQPDFNLYDLGPATGTTFLTFNLNNRINAKTKKPFVDPVRAKWFNNVFFRKAVDAAIDRNDMVQNILLGVGAPLYTAESLSSVYLNKSLANGHPKDLEKARAFLTQGGFKWNAEKQLVDAEGHRVEFTLMTNSENDQRQATGVSILQDLAELGIKVNFKPSDFNVLVGKLNNSDWEAVIMGLTGSSLEPHNGVNVWKSTGALHMFNQRDVKNLKGIPTDRFPWEAQLDTLFEQGAKAFDPAERQKIYNQYQEIAYEQLPFIYLYSPRSIMAVKTRIQNFNPTPLGALHNLEEIWVKEEKDTPQAARPKT